MLIAMIDLNIRQLRHFVLVAELGSFRAAAEKAFRSQPALSLSIRELEETLGEPLFEHGTRAKLTTFGQQCLPIAREMVQRHDELGKQMQASARAEAGEVTIALLPSFATRWLPELVRRFASDHPDVQIRLFDDNTRNIQEAVLSGAADFGVVSVIGIDRRLDVEPIAEDLFGVVCGLRHPLLRQRRSLKWRQLAREAIIGNLTHQLLDGTIAGEIVQSPRLFVANMTSLLSIVASGVGVSPLPALALPEKAPGLAFIPLTEPTVRRRIGIVRRHGRMLTPAARAAQELIRVITARHRP